MSEITGGERFPVCKTYLYLRAASLCIDHRYNFRFKIFGTKIRKIGGGKSIGSPELLESNLRNISNLKRSIFRFLLALLASFYHH